jgi:predicted ArsR family transcriptional regulator
MELVETAVSLPLSAAKRRLIQLLAQMSPVGAPALAEELELTGAAVRQHLGDIEELGLAERRSGKAQGRGRPSEVWSLTEAGRATLPDRHVDLAVEMIRHVRTALGEDALDALIAVRQREQSERYRSSIGDGPTADRLRLLAKLRCDEGYVAEVIKVDEGWILAEHHCPICDAAAECQGLCRGELETFQEVLGEAVRVVRQDHLLEGDPRCTYLIEPLDDQI